MIFLRGFLTIGNFTLGGLFTGILALVTILATAFGYLIFLGLLLWIFPAFVGLTIAGLVLLGILIGVWEVARGRRHG